MRRLAWIHNTRQRPQAQIPAYLLAFKKKSSTRSSTPSDVLNTTLAAGSLKYAMTSGGGWTIAVMAPMEACDTLVGPADPWGRRAVDYSLLEEQDVSRAADEENPPLIKKEIGIKEVSADATD